MADRPIQTDFAPTAGWENLRHRAHLLQGVRRFFDERGFLEVETPLLSRDTVVDEYLDPLRVVLFADPSAPRRGPTYWLQTSPEFAMKRLLAAGATAIYQVARAFRGGECGPLHNPEFTIVEWYRVGDGFEAGIKLLDEFSQALLRRGPAARLSYREAFRRWAGVDPLADDVGRLADAARNQGLVVNGPRGEADRDTWLNLLLGTVVQPQLGRGRPTILYHYPASQAALARLAPDDPAVAERFELFVDGVELANGYHELTDAAQLQRRARAVNARRKRAGKYVLPTSSRLLAAMRHGLPPSAGVALGFDRLVLVAVGAQSLTDVLPFPIDRA